MKKETTLTLLVFLAVLAVAVLLGASTRMIIELTNQNNLLREQNTIYREGLRCKEVKTTPTVAEVWCGNPIE